jgi:hypothetical protein
MMHTCLYEDIKVLFLNSLFLRLAISCTSTWLGKIVTINRCITDASDRQSEILNLHHILKTSRPLDNIVTFKSTLRMLGVIGKQCAGFPVRMFNKFSTLSVFRQCLVFVVIKLYPYISKKI